jgi:hypothetical protein
MLRTIFPELLFHHTEGGDMVSMAQIQVGWAL